MSIIRSLLDTDQYKFSMAMAVLHHFADTEVEYRFKCRNNDVDLSPYIDEIKREINSLVNMRFSTVELEYLSSLRFMKKDFILFLRNFTLYPEDHVQVTKDSTKPCGIDITVKGPWIQTIWFEIPILAIVNEVYFRNKYNYHDHSALILEGKNRFANKLQFIKKAFAPKFTFTDFGTRRRFSREWQQLIVKTLAQEHNQHFIGTSNVMLAYVYNITPIGTMAHEWVMAGQATNVRLSESQKYMFDIWCREYRGDLGTALTDTLGLDAFLRDFDLYFAKLFDGCRHDSGDPYEFGDRIIDHYKSLKIDPMSKHLIFSDSLDLQKAIDLYRYFDGRIKTGFGIGTNITNDMGVEPLNVVMKMVKCNGQPVAKISDSPGKGMCEDETFVQYIKSVFGIAA